LKLNCDQKSIIISVIIPVYNGEACIGGCLAALNHQTIKRSMYEIIVVNDGSTDRTRVEISKFEGVETVFQNNRGPASARNLGVRLAKGDLIIFTDADCIPEENFIEQICAPLMNNPEIAGAKGRYKTKQRGLVARFVQVEYEDKYDMMRSLKNIDFVDTYAAAYRKEVFEKTGGYDTRYPVACAEDVELSYRIAMEGHRLVYCPNAVVYHTHPESLKAYIKKKYKFAFWRVYAVNKKTAKILRDSHTPQLMKAQALVMPAAVLMLVMGFTSVRWMTAAIVALLLYLALSIPFATKAFRRDPSIGMTCLLFLMCRSLAQFVGLVSGSVARIYERDCEVR
jgi:cellulose synthase/poly-beta-1,6-N-acetylglucosamine synthase-like glycosyltransferase